MEGTIQRGMSQLGIPFNWDRFLGRDAQGALEHALKAVLAIHGRKYEHPHKLPELLEAAQFSRARLYPNLQPGDAVRLHWRH